MEKENQKELSKILGIGKGLRNDGEATWAEIYTEIGKLQERSIFKPVDYLPCTLPHFQNPQENNPINPGFPLPGTYCGGTQNQG